jgi:hypothetical protein
VSESPIDDVRLGVVIPILEEVDLDFHDAFEAVSRAEAEQRVRAERAAEAAASQVYHVAGSGRSEADTNDADVELAEVLKRSRAVLRERLPEAFDQRGRLRRRRLQQAIAARLPGRSELTHDEFLDLTEQLNRPSTSPGDAP